MTSIAELKDTQRPLAQMKPKEQIAHLLNQKKGELAKMLPKTLSIDRLLKVAQIAATTTPALAKCDVPSLVGAIGQCAQMGLEPNTVLGHAYLVPFNTKRKDAHGNERWVNSVQVIIGYKGLIDLARRSGQIVSIAAHEVCANDHFELVYGLDEKLNHKPALGDRGQIIGFYAIAKLKDGGHCMEFMSLHEVQQIMMDTQSKGKYGPWKDHFVQMGRKTVIRRLANYLPLSIEFQTAVALDGMAEAGKDQKLDTIDGDFLVVPDGDAEAPFDVDHDTGEIKGGRLSSNASVTIPQTSGQRDPAEFDEVAKAEQVRADYGDREAEHFEPNQPMPGRSGSKPRQNAAQAPAAQQQPPAFDLDAFANRISECTDLDALDVMADEVNGLARDQVVSDEQALTLHDVYLRRREELVNPPQAQAAAPAPAPAAPLQGTSRRRAAAPGTAPE